MRYRFTRFMVVLLLIAVCALNCFGCKKKADPAVNVPTGAAVDDNDDVENENGNSGSYIVKPGNTDGSGEETKLISFNYYTVNSSQNEVVTARAMITADTELTPEIIMENYIDSLEDDSIILGLNGVVISEKDPSFYLIDLTASIKDIAQDNPELEELILYSAAQSLIDNIDSCRRIGFLIDGGAYITANRSFDKDYIFMDE